MTSIPVLFGVASVSLILFFILDIFFEFEVEVGCPRCLECPKYRAYFEGAIDRFERIEYLKRVLLGVVVSSVLVAIGLFIYSVFTYQFFTWPPIPYDQHPYEVFEYYAFLKYVIILS